MCIWMDVWMSLSDIFSSTSLVRICGAVEHVHMPAGSFQEGVDFGKHVLAAVGA
ncbi:hypothetical protein Fraau_2927 [Frateuria aurantia DSM 6220]|uniref:Uncharacterized protein n=1 Tax=Frateuria aurantia (strain ATCC 33424 / DSM 6220 / KCTC 2777 / LMG 1558 / NBRC 3245 / NCIMB 13370) TaxID=767434 RepID=H8L202_FRAAD|nr:hypothetical protein Fraau_2927 [Frateuria aurantia DSM 6220]